MWSCGLRLESFVLIVIFVISVLYSFILMWVESCAVFDILEINDYLSLSRRCPSRLAVMFELDLVIVSMTVGGGGIVGCSILVIFCMRVLLLM